MQEPRSRRAVRLAMPLVREAANAVMERRLQTHLSQTQWEEVTEEIVREAAIRLDKDYAFCETVMEGDSLDPKGRVNARAVLDALKRMIDGAKNGGEQQRLEFLAQHFRKTMVDLRVLKDGEPHGQEKQQQAS